MDTGLAVRVRGLSKTYRISHGSDRPTRATEAIVARMRHPWRRAAYERFEALHDVDFDVAEGSALAIVGRNGAGKSTLLKVLTRVTAPTSGRIELLGRMGSLLEVGTGFHPELTGRENVFLNGTLLGMRRREIQARFDEIVEFSGCERFLDTPVKRYSSGMYVRLAFAVAAHLRTEILAIDEVLSVGDAEFQRKSLARMRDAAGEGRTVLYVSHQLHTVSQLCTEAILLDRGTVTSAGPTEGVLAAYRASFEQFSATQRQLRQDLPPGTLRLVSAETERQIYRPADAKRLTVRVQPEALDQGDYYLSCHINDAQGSVVAQCDSRLVGGWFDAARPQEVAFTVREPWLKPGRYSVDVFLCRLGVLDSWSAATSFEVSHDLPYGGAAVPEGYAAGLVLPDFEVEVSS